MLVCVRSGGEGGWCALPPSVTGLPSAASARPGLGEVGPGARGAAGGGGAADGHGARTPLGGDESRRASSTGANPGGGGGSASPSPRGRTGPGRAPPEGYRGGGWGWAPGLWGPGPGSSRAGAGETGRALGLRLVSGGGGAWEGRAGSRANPERPSGAGRGLPRAAAPWGGGGGVLPARGTTGVPLERGGGACIARCRAMSIHGRAAWDYIPNPPRRNPFLGGLRGGGGGMAVVVCTHPCGGGVAGGSSVRLGRKYPMASPGLVGPFEEEPRIRRGGLRYGRGGGGRGGRGGR